jgi:hypothetical protein
MHRARILAVAATLLCAGLPAVAAAQSEENAGVVTTVNGDATLIRAVASAQPVSLQLRDQIRLRDRIHTQPRSLVRVLLGGKALITVRELSILTVTEDAGRVTVDLQSGKIGVAVVKGRMRPGEVIEVRSPNATAAVRGTVFVVEVDPIKGGSGVAPAHTTRVHLLRGALDVSAHLDPAQPAVRLAQMQSLTVAGNAIGSVRALSSDEVATVTSDLRPKQVRTIDTPDEFVRGLVAREQNRAILLGTALLPLTSGGPVLPGGLKTPVEGVTGAVSNLTDTTTETLDRLMASLGLSDTAAGSLVQGVGRTLNGTVDGLGAALTGTVGKLPTGLVTSGSPGPAPSLPVAGLPALPSLPLGGGLPTGGGVPLGGGGVPTSGGLPLGGGGSPIGGGALPLGGLPTGGGLPPAGLPIPALPAGPVVGLPTGGGLPIPVPPIGPLGGK